MKVFKAHFKYKVYVRDREAMREYVLEGTADELVKEFGRITSCGNYFGSYPSPYATNLSTPSVLASELRSYIFTCWIDGIPVTKKEFLEEVKANQSKMFISKRQIVPFTQDEIAQFKIRFMDNCFEVHSPCNLEDYESLFESSPNFYNGKILTLYHGTHRSNVHDIVTVGFRRSRYGALGPGLYFGTKEKAQGYVGKMRRMKWKPGYTENPTWNTMIECQVLLGNLADMNNLDMSKWRRGRGSLHGEYDTLYYGLFSNPEWCIKNINQAIIKRVLFV